MYAVEPIDDMRPIGSDPFIPFHLPIASLTSNEYTHQSHQSKSVLLHPCPSYDHTPPPFKHPSTQSNQNSSAPHNFLRFTVGFTHSRPAGRSWCSTQLHPLFVDSETPAEWDDQTCCTDKHLVHRDSIIVYQFDVFYLDCQTPKMNDGRMSHARKAMQKTPTLPQ
jgi:hypothetical protein